MRHPLATCSVASDFVRRTRSAYGYSPTASPSEDIAESSLGQRGTAQRLPGGLDAGSQVGHCSILHDSCSDHVAGAVVLATAGVYRHGKPIDHACQIGELGEHR